MLYRKIKFVVALALCFCLAMPMVHALAKLGTFTQHQFAVYTDSSDAPGSQIGANNQSVTLNVTTKYWLVIQVEPTGDADELYIGLQYDIWDAGSWKGFNESTVARDVATQWAFANTAKSDLEAASTHFTDTTDVDQKKEYIVQHLETLDSTVWDNKYLRGEVWYPINTTDPSSETTYDLRFVRSLTQNGAATVPDTIVTRVSITVTVPDTIAPDVALNAPINGTNTSLVNVSFNFTGTDGSGIGNATLYANFSGTWEANESILSGLVSGQSALINVTDAPEGRFIWNVLVCDDAPALNCGFNTTGNFTLTVDRTPPTTILEFPADDSYNDTSDPVGIHFNCSAEDNLSTLYNISIYITNRTNESFKFNRSTLVTGVNASANWTLSLENGNYSWNCLAYDVAGNFDWGNSNNSIEINATITNNPPTIQNVSIDDAITSPAGEIDLTPGATRQVNCTGTNQFSVAIG